MTTFYDFSGGMESAAMLVVDRVRIRETGAIVRWVDTGKQFPEMGPSVAQIGAILGIEIVEVPLRITFDEFFHRGGIVKRGTTDCSRRMKRSNLMRHMKTFERPYEVNLGFNSAETERADSFALLNERPWLHWRFPLIEADKSRPDTVSICREAGFKILVQMYERMGRFDCFFCGNQRPSQALKVIEHYPQLAREWMNREAMKGHSFMAVPIAVLMGHPKQTELFAGGSCGCFGGSECVIDPEDDEVPQRAGTPGQHETEKLP